MVALLHPSKKAKIRQKYIYKRHFDVTVSSQISEIIVLLNWKKRTSFSYDPLLFIMMVIMINFYLLSIKIFSYNPLLFIIMVIMINFYLLSIKTCKIHEIYSRS